MDSPLVQSSICDVTSEVCCCDVTMTSFSSLVITWHSRLGRLAPVRWRTAETRWMNSVTLDLNIPLICDRALFSPLYGSWSRADGILQRCHVDVWTETKIVCMINSGPFVLWPKIENNIQYMCSYITYLDGHVWPAALWLSPVKTSLASFCPLRRDLRTHTNSHPASARWLITRTHSSWLVLCAYLE